MFACQPGRVPRFWGCSRLPAVPGRAPAPWGRQGPIRTGIAVQCILRLHAAAPLVQNPLRRRRRPVPGLPGTARVPMLPCMFVVTEAEAAAIRAAFAQGGEFAAAVELRRQFPGIADNAHARACARIIADWKPLTLPPRPAARPRKLSHR